MDSPYCKKSSRLLIAVCGIIMITGIAILTGPDRVSKQEK